MADAKTEDKGTLNTILFLTFVGAVVTAVYTGRVKRAVSAHNRAQALEELGHIQTAAGGSGLGLLLVLGFYVQWKAQRQKDKPRQLSSWALWAMIVAIALTALIMAYVQDIRCKVNGSNLGAAAAALEVPYWISITLSVLIGATFVGTVMVRAEKARKRRRQESKVRARARAEGRRMTGAEFLANEAANNPFVQ